MDMSAEASGLDLSVAWCPWRDIVPLTGMGGFVGIRNEAYAIALLPRAIVLEVVVPVSYSACTILVEVAANKWVAMMAAFESTPTLGSSEDTFIFGWEAC